MMDYNMSLDDLEEFVSMYALDELEEWEQAAIQQFRQLEQSFTSLLDLDDVDVDVDEVNYGEEVDTQQEGE